MLEVSFLGTAAVQPEPGGDSTSLLLNGTLLIDTGWYAPYRLLSFGYDPLLLTHLIFTHFHHDHYLALPQVLFQRMVWMGKVGRSVTPLTIAGPAGELERVVGAAQDFLQAGASVQDAVPPVLVPLKPGETWEASGLRFEVGRASHTVPAHCYRVTDPATGASLGLTGDTEYTEEIVSALAGVDLLVAEASYGANPAPASNSTRHMGAPDAARLARAARAKRLALVHTPLTKRAEAVAAAQAIFPNTFWPADGQCVHLPDNVT